MKDIELELKSAKYKQLISIETGPEGPRIKSIFAYNPMRFTKRIRHGCAWVEVISSQWAEFRYVVCWPFESYVVKEIKESGVLIWTN